MSESVKEMAEAFRRVQIVFSDALTPAVIRAAKGLKLLLIVNEYNNLCVERDRFDTPRSRRVLYRYLAFCKLMEYRRAAAEMRGR